jgi:hypothetical protein
MNSHIEGSIAIVAALLVLFSAMWDPRISIVVSIISLGSLGVYRLARSEKEFT